MAAEIIIKFKGIADCSCELKAKPVEEGITTEEFLENICEGKPVVVKILKPCSHLKEAFSHELPLSYKGTQVYVKLYPEKKGEDCNKELKAWREVRKSPYFHFVPAVLPKVYSVSECDASSRQFYGIVMEKAEGEPLDKWFDDIITTANSLPIVLHQFFSVWFQLFDLIKFLHEIHLYHTDFKPENIIFSNNSLRLIDFNTASTDPYVFPHCTTQYAPSRILDARSTAESIPDLHRGFVDLYLTGQTLLESLVKICCCSLLKRDAPQFFKDIKQSFIEKKKIYKKYKSATERIPENNKEFNNAAKLYYEKLKQENSKIWKSVQEWHKQTCSISSGCFLLLLDEKNLNKCNDYLEHVNKEPLSKSRKEFIAATLSDIGFHEEHGDLGKGIPELMSKLLTNYTSNIFSHEYPLIYLDYSKSTQAYDEQAKLAMNFANTNGYIKPSTCLDVGCAFGTAAFHAHEKIKAAQITCLDNNPYFERLAGLLWKPNQWKSWKKYFPKGKELFEEMYDEKKGGEKLGKLLQEYNKKYSGVQKGVGKEWKYTCHDYWELADKEIKYDLIICNNFLHWPVIDFQRMNEDCSDFYKQDMGKSSLHLKYLIDPLLNSLNKEGVLIIVEPSQFFMDDINKKKDEDFHETRFTNNKLYCDAQEYARNELSKATFKVKLGNVPERREVKFLSSSFQELCIENSYEVQIKKERHEFKTNWPMTIRGEFYMTLRNLEMDKIQKIQSSENLASFYKDFGTYLGNKDWPEQNPKETIYIVLISKK